MQFCYRKQEKYLMLLILPHPARKTQISESAHVVKAMIKNISSSLKLNYCL